jgi:hypothetical protein
MFLREVSYEHPRDNQVDVLLYPAPTVSQAYGERVYDIFSLRRKNGPIKPEMLHVYITFDCDRLN